MPEVSVQEGSGLAARTVSEDETDNTTSEQSSLGDTAASRLDAAPKTAPRKVAFQLPDPSEHDSDSEISDTSLTYSPRERLNLDEIDFNDPEAFKRFMEYMRPRDYFEDGNDGNKSLDGDGHDDSDHSVPARHQGSEDEMEESRTSTESQEKTLSGLDDTPQETGQRFNTNNGS